MQRTNNSKFIFIILLMPLFLTGCYDRFELDNLAYVIAIGIDPGENGNVNISYQVAVPVKITGEGSESGKDTYTTYTISSPSLSMGNSMLNTLISKEINLSHIKLIVYSEELAKSGLSGHVNVFMSHTEIRPKVTFAICQGSAEKLLNEVSPTLEVSPARYYELLFSSFNYTGFEASSELVDFYTSLQSIDRESFSMYIKLSDKSGDKKEIESAGLAIFKDSKMIDILEPELIFPHLILTNSLKKTNYAIPDFNDSSKVISMRIDHTGAPYIKVTLDGDIPKIYCNIKLHAHLVSSGSAINFYDSQNKDRLIEELNISIENLISRYFDKTIHEYQSDISGMGRMAKMNFLTWNEFENYNWLSKYKNSIYEIEVDTDVNISQIISHKVPNSDERN